MKKYNVLTIAALAALLASCAKENLLENGPEKEQPQITISASIVNGPETKTYMDVLQGTGDDAYYPIKWSPNDKIALFSKNSSAVFTLSSIDEEDGTLAEFVGGAGNMPLKVDGADVYAAAYPADKAFACIADDGNLFVGSYLPQHQPYKENTFSDDVFPMASASADVENFPFYNLCGVIQIPIKTTFEGSEVAIRSIRLSGNDGEVLAGGVGMKFDKQTGDPIVSDGDKLIGTYGSEEYSFVYVNFDEPITLDAEPTYINIAVIPQTFSNGFTVELTDAYNSGTISYKITSPVTIKRSVLTKFKTIDHAKPEPLQVANSYVYSDAGYYLMPAYAMGNRLDVPLPTKGRNLAADLLWCDLVKPAVTDNTTNRDELLPAVTNIEYFTDDSGFGMLQFKINKDNNGNPYRGNAAIALYDADSKEVIWSWHIWMTETPKDVITGGSCADGTYSFELPDGTKVDYAAEASSGQLIIMDRNLGAISADPADGWKTYGLYYQNGRRDPFIGGHWDGTTEGGGAETCGNDGMKVRNDESDPFLVKSDDTEKQVRTAPVWYNEELAPKAWHYQQSFQDVSTAIRFPMTFSSGQPTNGQWTNYADSDNKSWLDPNAGSGKKGKTSSGGTHGNTGLSDGGHEAYWNRTKTIMDPCPTGYSILGERGGLYLGNDTKTFRWETSESGHSVYGMVSRLPGYADVWWPAAGVRTVEGKLADVGFRGMYFHYDHIAADHGGHGSGFNYGGSWKSGITTNHAASVRCVREKQFGNLDKYPLQQ